MPRVWPRYWSRQYQHLCYLMGAIRWALQTPPHIIMCGKCPLSRRVRIVLGQFRWVKSWNIMSYIKRRRHLSWSENFLAVNFDKQPALIDAVLLNGIEWSKGRGHQNSAMDDIMGGKVSQITSHWDHVIKNDDLCSDCLLSRLHCDLWYVSGLVKIHTSVISAGVRRSFSRTPPGSGLDGSLNRVSLYEEWNWCHRTWIIIKTFNECWWF